MESFIEERTDRFVVGSRESLMRDMLTFAAADGEPNIFVLTGDPGSGKSALLAKFTRDVASLYPSSFILPHFVGVPAPAPPISAAHSAGCATNSPSLQKIRSPCRSTSRNSSPISKSS